MAGIPLSEAGRAILYRPPATSSHQIFGVFAKTPSYEKGEYPDQLKSYAGQMASCARECKGRKGRNFSLCLKKCAIRNGITKHR